MPIIFTDKANASVQNTYQLFNQNLSKELNQYIKKSGGSITLNYKEFSTGDECSRGQY